ncbi:hypothetical protein PMAYCL1PPCAC_32707 [Pristionchus mayeri]|uniref:MARVEL domain-containing protein n=1 Tax=Pristionchus mayeri TaxID=1317129 RepID=A0AAN5DHZ1_9BILA|nr:hypothetical protein PMAYCL1PPCAC_32707 [Pristionchus mayeri]
MSGKADFYLEVYPKTYDVNGRNFLMDMVYLPSTRGLIKVFEIVLCFFAMICIAMSQGVEEERNFGLFVSFLGLSCSFCLLVSYILMLNSRMSQFCWVLLEGSYYVIMSCLLLAAAVCMWVFCADYWSYRNPIWHTWPALAAATLFVATIVFVIDLCLVIRFYNRYSWHPTFDYATQSVPTTQTIVATR